MRNFGNPYIDPLVEQAQLQLFSDKNPAPLPKPTGDRPYRMDLSSVLSDAQMNTIRSKGEITFNMVGDTGGVLFPLPQRILTTKLEQELPHSSFLYILGDVTYYTGDIDKYYAQFYAPFEHFTAPIFSIPGNHDGTTKFLLSTTGEASLTAWMRTFCAKEPVILPEAGDVRRDAMTQPNCYFTLLTPYATIIGLYSNVPDGGYFDKDQYDWFVGELRDASANKAIIVTVHHSPYSLDTTHGGSAVVRDFIDKASVEAKRSPSAIFSGHTHNYQRFTKYANLRQTPYVVVGTGGYFDLYKLNREYTVPANIDNQLTLESYQIDRHGYVTLTVNKNQLMGEYKTIPKPWEAWSNASKLHDSFTMDWRAGVVI